MFWSEVAMESNDNIWVQTQKDLGHQMAQATYNNLIKDARLVGAEDGTYTVEVQSDKAKDWLEHRLNGVVERALSGVVGKPVRAVFVVEAERMPERKGPTRVKLEGFTPVVDSLAREVGLISAAIYGVIWRYCQMNSRTCYASQATIANRLGLARATVNRRVKSLEIEGYIRCLNRKEKGDSKVYITTNKLEIDLGFVMKARKVGDDKDPQV